MAYSRLYMHIDLNVIILKFEQQLATIGCLNYIAQIKFQPNIILYFS